MQNPLFCRHVHVRRFFAYSLQIFLSPKVYDRETYIVPNTIIAQKLISQAPKQKCQPHHVMLEKLLVDLLADPKMLLFKEKRD